MEMMVHPAQRHGCAAVIYLVGVNYTKRHDFFLNINNTSNIPIDNRSPYNTLIINWLDSSLTED
jgi:hypothetical protein